MVGAMFHQTATCEDAKARRQGANPVARPRCCRFPLLPVLAAALALLLGAEAARAQQVPLTVFSSHICPQCPNAPTGTAEPGPGNGEITLRWQWSKGSKPDVARWKVQCSASVSSHSNYARTSLGSGTREHTCRNLTPGVEYSARVNGYSATNWTSSVMHATVNSLFDLEPPQLRSARTDGLRLWLTFDERLDPDAVPSPGAFEVHAGSDRMIDHRSVSVAGDTVVLDLKRPLKRRDFKWLTYVQPESDTSRRVQDVHGNEAVEFTIPDSNKGLKLAFTDTRAPELLTAMVSGTTVVLTFDEALDPEFEPPRGSFVVHGSSSGAIAVDENVDAVQVAGRRVTLTLERTLVGEELGFIDYNPPEDPDKRLQDLAGNFVAAISDGALEKMGGHNNAPQLTGSEVIGSTLTLSYGEKLDRVSVPTAGAFTVTVAGNAVDLAASNAVSVGETAVTLTLAEPVFAGETVTLDYTAPDYNPIQDLAHRNAENLSGRSVQNNTAGGTVPALTRAVVAGRTLTLSYDEKLDRGSVPAASAFTVRVGGSAVGLAASDPVSVGETAVTLTLAAAVAAGARVTLDYTAPTVNPIQDLAGYNAADFSGQFVGNAASGDMRGPKFLSATVSGKTVVLTYDEGLDLASTPSTASFQVSYDGVNYVNPEGVSVAGHRVTLTLATAATGNVLVTYNRPDAAGFSKLVDYAGNPADEFPDVGDAKLATNTAGDRTAPLLTWAGVDGTALTLSYGEKLDRGSVPAASAFTVRVGGSAVGLAASDPVSVGETAVTLTLAAAVAAGARVTLDYTVPGDNPIRDLAGNAAADFSGQFVGNAASGDMRGPKFLSATVSGKTVVLTYDEGLDLASTPSTASFQVSYDGVNYVNPEGVSVAGHRVTLTLATAATGNVLVTYNRPDAAGFPKLVDYAGNPADEFPDVGDAKLATNTAGDRTAPLLTWAGVDGTALTLSYGEKLDRGSVPAASAFTVRVGGSAVGLAASDPVSVGETVVTLTLAAAVAAGARVTLDYTVPGDNPIRDLAGNDAADFSGQFVGNADGDTRVPRIRYATVNGTTVKLVFDEGLDPASAPAGTRFTVQDGNGTISTGTGTARIVGAEVTVTLGTDVTAAQVVDCVQYNKPGTNPLQDHAGNAVGNVIFEDDKVRNIRGEMTAPALTRAVADGATVTLRYGEWLDRVSVPAAAAFTVKVNGADVEFGATGRVSVGESSVTLTLAAAVSAGDAATVAYAAPQDNPIRDLVGNAAAPIAERTAHNVTSDPAAGPSLRTARLEGETLTLVFSETLDPASAPAGDRFTIVSSGTTVSTGTGTAGIEGAVVTVTMNAAVTAANPVVKYRVPTANPLKDLDGIKAAAISSSIESSRVVRVASVAITSTPGRDSDGDGVAESYVRDDPVEVTVTWDDYVTWDVSASNAEIRVTLKVPKQSGGTNTRTAALVTDGAKRGRARAFVFRYDVQSGDVEAVTPKGIEVAGGTLVKLVRGATLEVENGRVRQTATGLPADLGHQVRGGETWSDRTPPRLVAGKMEFLGPTQGTRFTLQFSEPLHPDSDDVKPYLNFRYVDESDGLPNAMVTAEGNTLVMQDPGVWIDGSMTNAWVEIGDTSHIRDLAGNAMAPLERRFPLVNTSTGSPGSPRLASAAVIGEVLTLVFDQTLDQAEVPTKDAFKVLKTSEATSVSGVTVAGSVVTLTLDRAVGGDDGDIRVTYSKNRETGPPLCNLWGSEVAEFKRDIARDSERPKLVEGTIDRATARLLYDETLDATVAPSAEQFTLSANDGTTDRALAVNGVRIVGATVTLTLTSAATAAETVEVVFADATGVRDLTGNRAAAQGDAFVLTNTGAGSPGAPVPVADGMNPAVAEGKRLTLTFTQKLDPSLVPAASAFTVWTEVSPDLPRTEIPVHAVTIDRKAVLLTLRRTVPPGLEEYKVTYAEPPAAGLKLRNLWLEAVADFEKTVEVTAPDTTAPRLVQAEVAHAELKLTFDEALDASFAPPASAFEVWAIAPDDTVNILRGKEGVDATVADKVVTVTLSGAARQHELLSMDYRASDAGGNALRDTAGNRVASTRNARAENVDVYPPRLLGGTVDGSEVKLHFSEPLNTPLTPDSGDFSWSIPAGIDAGTVTGATIELTLNFTVAATGTLAVNLKSQTKVRDLAGNKAVVLSSPLTLANLRSSTENPGTPALVATDAVVVDGAYLTITYDQRLDPGVVPAREAYMLTSFTAAVDGVAIKDREVILALNAPVPPCERFEAPTGEDPNLVLTYDSSKATTAGTSGPRARPVCRTLGGASRRLSIRSR